MCITLNNTRFVSPAKLDEFWNGKPGTDGFPGVKQWVEEYVAEHGGEGEQSPFEKGLGEHSAQLKNSGSVASGDYSVAEGWQTRTSNECEHAEGQWNKSNTGDTNVKKTIHSVGIGSDDNTRKNAVEVMQNGDVYIKDVGGYQGTSISGVKPLQQCIHDIYYIDATYDLGDDDVTITTSRYDIENAFNSGKLLYVKFIGALQVNIFCPILSYESEDAGVLTLEFYYQRGRSVAVMS